MHALEPKHSKLKPEEVDKIVSDLNISLIQLPKIKVDDPGLPKDCKVGDVIKIERVNEEGETVVYYRVVSV